MTITLVKSVNLTITID